MLGSCIDRLDFFGNTQGGQLVIYGMLNDVDEIQSVQISRTNFLGFNPKGEDGASVTLLTQDGRRLRYSNTGNGNYILTDFKGTPGQSYSLEVFVGKELYVSTVQTMPNILAVDSLEFRFGRELLNSEAEEGVFTVSATSKIPAGENSGFFRWTAEETYQWQRTWLPCVGLCPPPPNPCYISDLMDPNRINLFDGNSSRTRQTSQEIAKRAVDNSFIGIFYVSLKQHSITRDAFEYWRKIDLIVNNRGSLFDIPPAPVYGNITNRNNPDEIVLGFFEVARVRYTRKYVNPADVPFFLTRPCEIIVGKPASEYAAECVQCEVRAKGRAWTTTAPEWWFKD
jgi:hypothetical protein